MLLVLILVFGGLALGSFVNALVWRLRQQELASKKPKVIKSIKSRFLSTFNFQLSTDQNPYGILAGRSMCPHCRHQLAWYDLLPVVSWLALRGRCRYCRRAIAWQYPLVELLSAGLFVSLGLALPTDTGAEVIELIFWLGSSVLLLALAIYDLRWMMLPNRLVYPLLVWALLYIAVLAMIGDNTEQVMERLIGAVVSGGLFYGLFQLSGGRWLGGGDVKLAAYLGLALGWRDALLAITLAAWLGLAAYGVLALAGKSLRQRQLPFGPCLIAAAYLILFFGDWLIDGYLALAGLR